MIYQLPVPVCEMFIQEIFGSESLDSLDNETLTIIRTFFENNLNLAEKPPGSFMFTAILWYTVLKKSRKNSAWIFGLLKTL